MWWRRLAAAAIATALVGCGFQPLYGDRPGGPVSRDLSRISVSPIATPVGQQVYGYLLDGLRPGEQPLYRLAVTLTSTQTGVVVGRDARERRFDFRLNATYRLLDIESGAEIHRGLATTVASYNVVPSDFATEIARREAFDRAAEEIGREIVTRLAVMMGRGR